MILLLKSRLNSNHDFESAMIISVKLMIKETAVILSLRGASLQKETMNFHNESITLYNKNLHVQLLLPLALQMAVNIQINISLIARHLDLIIIIINLSEDSL